MRTRHDKGNGKKIIACRLFDKPGIDKDGENAEVSRNTLMDNSYMFHVGSFSLA